MLVLIRNYLGANKVQSSKLTVLTRHDGQLKELPKEDWITQRNQNACMLLLIRDCRSGRGAAESWDGSAIQR
jgi:hypothetical protein